MKKILVAIVVCSFLLSGCEQIHEATRSYPIDKHFSKTQKYSWDTSEIFYNAQGKYTVGIKLKLSFKSDKRVYYSIELNEDYLKLSKKYSMNIRLFDKNGMMVNEFAPIYYAINSHSIETDIPDGKRIVGNFELEEGLFRDIHSYEPYIYQKW